MARPERYLADGEDLVLRLRPHGRVLLWPFVVLLVLAAGGGAIAGATRGQQAQAQLDAVLLGLGAVVTLGWVVRPFLRWWTTQYVLTSQQVLLVRGLLARTARHLPLHRIDSLSVDRDVIDRLLGCGTLTIRSTGGADALVLVDVPQVRSVERVLTSLLDAHDAGELGEPDDGDGDGPDDFEMDLTDPDRFGGVDEDWPDEPWGDPPQPPARRRRWRR